jgi:hypothetical protein
MGNRQPRTDKPWQTNLFWGFVGISIGIWLTVIAQVLHDLRPILWAAWAIFAIPIYMISRAIAKRFLKKAITFLVLWFAIFAVTRWFVHYKVPDILMPVEATHTGYEPLNVGMHEHFTAGKCQSGKPEAGQEVQWTWYLEGAHFECKSNELDSDATIAFEQRAYQSVAIHAGTTANPIHARIEWYSERADGRVKWELSAECANPGVLTHPDYNEVVAIEDPPVAEAGIKTSDIVMHSVVPCFFPDYLSLRLARRGDDKDDTLGATAYLTGLYLESQGTAIVPEK